MPGFIVCIYWDVKYFSIYNWALIDNHFIPLSNPGGRKTVQEQWQKQLKSLFTLDQALVSESYSSETRLILEYGLLDRQCFLHNKSLCWITSWPLCTFFNTQNHTVSAWEETFWNLTIKL